MEGGKALKLAPGVGEVGIALRLTLSNPAPSAQDLSTECGLHAASVRLQCGSEVVSHACAAYRA